MKISKQQTDDGRAHTRRRLVRVVDSEKKLRLLSLRVKINNFLRQTFNEDNHHLKNEDHKR